MNYIEKTIEEFDKEFPELLTQTSIKGSGMTHNSRVYLHRIEPAVKYFITNSLKNLVKEIERKSPEDDNKPHNDTMELNKAIAWQEGYNNCLKELKQLLSEYK